MSIHEVKVGERIREKTPSGKDRGVTSASIIVKPPITPGEYFNSAIRGRNPDGISLHHIVTTSEVTIFEAASSLENPERRDVAISTIADRIKRLVDNPEKVTELIDETPFSRLLKK